MNKLQGTVTGMETEGGISLVEADVQGHRFSSLVLEGDETRSYLTVGSRIIVLFKESEVSVATESFPGISIRNRIPCAIRSIIKGRILSHLILDFRGRDIHSLISTHSLIDLGLHPGQAIEALIKSTEVSLAADHG
ncbi:MAG: hypothetical protein JWO30_4897 [Fibrobacteres bacterium]|nr:hypothetical protein [Fibrobacterota bacterium]